LRGSSALMGFGSVVVENRSANRAFAVSGLA
jgi:hypothetical protein